MSHTQELSKVNQEIYDLCKRVDEIEETDYSSEFQTRDKMICANIKVYEWLDSDDVTQIITENNLSDFEEEIMEEFDEDRLGNIYNHTCEDWVSGWKEQYEGNCDLMNFKNVWYVWNCTQNFSSKEDAINEIKSESAKYYVGVYFDSARKFKTRKEWVDYINKKNEADYKEYCKRDQICKFQVGQYGRSGGWLSICHQDEVDFDFENSNLVYEILRHDGNDNFNEILNDYDYSYKNKGELIAELKKEIKTVDDKIAAINSIIDDIEGSKKHFKSSLLERLREEVLTFSNELDTVPEPNVAVSVEENMIKTTMGITVPYDDFRKAFLSIKDALLELKETEVLKINKRVGGYVVEKAINIGHDILIKAGCHKFSVKQIQTVIS